MQKYAKHLFEIIGSTQLPTEDRNDFTLFFKNYCSAVDKTSVIEEIKTFLIANPHINSFEYSLANDDGYTTVQNLRVLDYDGNHITNIDDLEDILSNYKFREFLAYQEITLLNLPNILSTKLTANENSALYMVDHYERNMLDSAIEKPITTKQSKL